MAIEFEIRESEILKGVYVIKPNKFKDNRGEIWTAFTKESIGALLPSGVEFVHDKFIHSKQNVIRGIHGDKKTYKLATCVYGEVMQVVVDCRVESPTYLKYESFIINSQNQEIILVPKGFGNAHLVRSNEAVYYYKCAYNGAYADFDEQFTYAYNDSRININWGIENPILSERDILATRGQK